MTRDEAIQRIGPLETTGEVVDEANAARQQKKPGEMFFPGKNTSWGYFREGVEVEPEGLDYSELVDAVEFARSLAAEAAELELVLSSESDNPYRPFVLRLDEAGEELIPRLRACLGLSSDERLNDITQEPAQKFLFFDEDELDVAREYLADEEDDDDPDDQAVLDAIGKDESNSAYSEEEVAGYRQLTATMAAELGELCHLRFDYEHAPDAYVVAPELFVGLYDEGYAVGLWANRVMT